MDYLNRPIIITGCARSGTSMVAGVVNLSGAWMGKVTGPTQWNKKGQFENEFIRDKLTKPFLQSIGADPMGQDPLPDTDRLMADAPYLSGAWRAKAEQALRVQGYPGAPYWAFKGAKACLIWPVWNAAFPEAQWVIVRREDDKIIDSCLKAPFMKKRRTREGWQEWIDHHKRCFEEIKGNTRNWQEIWPGRMMKDPKPWKIFVESLFLDWDEEKVYNFLEPKLWNGG